MINGFVSLAVSCHMSRGQESALGRLHRVLRLVSRESGVERPVGAASWSWAAARSPILGYHPVLTLVVGSGRG